LEPSTKMLGLVDLLNEWDNTGDKTICYSSVGSQQLPCRELSLTMSYRTSMLDLVEKIFARHGIRSLSTMVVWIGMLERMLCRHSRRPEDRKSSSLGLSWLRDISTSSHWTSFY